MMGFGSVSRRTNPLEVSSFCCLCRVLRKAFSPTTVVVKQNQLGNAELPPPTPPQQLRVLFEGAQEIFTFFLQVFMFLLLSSFFLPPFA